MNARAAKPHTLQILKSKRASPALQPGWQTIDRFGRIDTWVNNAGISIFGRLEEIAPEDHHRLFQTNFWGTVNGSLEAARCMKRGSGGASQMISAGSKLMPAMFDRYMNATMFRQQQSNRPTLPGRRDALYKPDPATELRQRQSMPQNVHERSLYTRTSLRSSPTTTLLVAGGALLAAFSLSRRLAR